MRKINKPIEYLEFNISKFTAKAAGTNLSEIQDWLSDIGLIEKFHANIKKEQEVFTLLSPEKAKMIGSFFHPPKVLCADNKETRIENLVKINGKSGILIQGRLGQGKSILLKYLQFLELNTGNTLPIFLELRKIKNAAQIISEARSKLNLLGLPASRKLFDFLLSEGRVSLFLDGFDELSLEDRLQFNGSLSEICLKYPSVKLLVTSRYNTEISTNTNFKKYSISLMKEEDIAPFIKKILNDESLFNPIISKISESDQFDFEVLDTPLLITWFIVVYNRRLKIPKTKLGFYEDLFLAILSRHDGFKGSYNRPTKSKLSDDEIKSVFCALCYVTRKAEIRVFSSDEIKSYVQQALNICEFHSINAGDFVYDLTHVTCLLKQDGLEYEFIHESVVQYFSASFLKSITEENAIEFYSNRISDWAKFEGELGFLSQIDKYRYVSHFYMPSVQMLLRENNGKRTIKNSSVTELFSSSIILVPDLEFDEDSPFVVVFPSKNYVLRQLWGEEVNVTFGAQATKFVKESIIKDSNNLKTLRHIFSSNDAMVVGKIIYCSFNKYIESSSLTNEFVDFIKADIDKDIVLALEKSEQVISSEKKKKQGGLFS
ncbi:NACHT domain-containing protein [Vibrio vulnificus]|uniref:NACHT domain-containing protein n=1 Tax=Vibrio vulnificus TaxID=672 RepID=UPI001CDBB307|nr:NACHT domain-containing protein [Vibrio vulnificus]EHZ7343712.1 NACHT domain-containing protein [Vibrio vulnificus]MCA4014548.1 NACHT domain-containing protein [Vibrio vulnificus]HDY7931932.1 NACHT domain-containing protein [Vibrio vulnificus]